MKKRLLLVYVFIAFVLLCTNVYAVVTMDLDLIADKETVKPGEELLVTVNVKNPSKPISSIEGYINIDEAVLGEFSKNMIVTEDGKIEVSSGSKVSRLNYAFNPEKTDADYDVIFNTNKENIGEDNDCFFVMDLKEDISSANTHILKFKFDVKESAAIKTVKDAVKIDLLVAYSDNENDKTEPISEALDIKVEKKEEDKKPDDNKPDDNKPDDNKQDEQKPDNNNGGSNNNGNGNNGNGNNGSGNNGSNNNGDSKKDKDKDKNTNNNTNTNKNTNTNNNKNKVANNTNTDGTVSGNKIPAAGARMLFIPVVIFAILAYISYNKYIKYKDI